MNYKLKVLFSPKWWFRNGSTNKIWDKALKRILESNNIKFEYINNYKVNLNGFVVWVANYPYAYATYGGFYPSRSTAMMFDEKYTEWMVNRIVGKNNEK